MTAPGAIRNDGDDVFRFLLNGKPVETRCAPERRLLSILREDFMLIAAKPGCEVGRCGACMVWLDDAPANACLVMAWQLEGRAVTTLEGGADDPRFDVVCEAMARSGAVQCGYCSAGMVMTLTWLHSHLPAITSSEALEHMNGNLCRCTGYGGLKRAVCSLFDPSHPAPLDQKTWS